MTLPSGPFPVIYADPPWTFKTRSAKGLDGRPQHYPRMSMADIVELPVLDVAADDCWLFLWTTGPHLPQALRVMTAWDFHYSGIGFVWIKTNKNAPSPLINTDTDLFMGGGYTTRKNAEICFLGRRGQPKRLSRSVREVLISKRREHSRKPDEFYDRIEQFAAGPYLELFARQTRPGWSAWGNETTKFNNTESQLI